MSFFFLYIYNNNKYTLNLQHAFSFPLIDIINESIGRLYTFGIYKNDRQVDHSRVATYTQIICVCIMVCATELLPLLKSRMYILLSMRLLPISLVTNV